MSYIVHTTYMILKRFHLITEAIPQFYIDLGLLTCTSRQPSSITQNALAFFAVCTWVTGCGDIRKRIPSKKPFKASKSETISDVLYKDLQKQTNTSWWTDSACWHECLNHLSFLCLSMYNPQKHMKSNKTPHLNACRLISFLLISSSVLSSSATGVCQTSENLEAPSASRARLNPSKLHVYTAEGKTILSFPQPSFSGSFPEEKLIHHSIGSLVHFLLNLWTLNLFNSFSSRRLILISLWLALMKPL